MILGMSRGVIVMVTQLMLIKDADKGLNPSKSLPQMQLRDSENSPPSQTIVFSVKVFKDHIYNIKQPQTLPGLGGNTLGSKASSGSPI